MDREIALQLKKALDLLRSGQAGSARKILVEALKQDADSDQAWFLLSFAIEEEERKIYAIQQALRINPGNAKAIERLAALQGVGDTGSLQSQASVPQPPSGREEPRSAGTDLLSQRMSTLDEEPVAEEPAAQVEVQSAFVPGAAFDDAEFEEEEEPERGRRARILRALLIFLVLLVVVGAIAGLLFFRESIPIFSGSAPQSLEQAGVFDEPPTATPTEEGGLRELPPTWTPTVSPTATETPLPPPTFTPTPPPTPLPLAAPIQAAIDEIRQQVSAIRGLPIVSEPLDNIVSRDRVEQIIRDEYINEIVVSELEDEKRILVALGLVDPEYDLVTYALNGRADNIGGFYLPERDEIYIIGQTFGGIEKWIYAHEFTHALQDQNFDLNSYGVYPDCEVGSDGCSAFRALAEGDASLLAEQWLTRHASGQDLQDILAYSPPPGLILEEFPPPYIQRELSFPYMEGRDFVEAVHNQGGWSAVSEAYNSPPISTEQIIHPQKFIDGEVPLLLEPFDFSGVLGDGWREIRSDSLGEWMTFLILGYGADVTTQAPENLAQQATAGWNGDRLGVYYNDSSDELVLAAQWFWDSPEDGEEFAEQFEDYLDSRYDGYNTEGPVDGLCWETETEANCFVIADEEMLWMMAPSFELISQVFDNVDFGF